MKTTMLTAEMIADFKSKGGRVKKVSTGANSGLRKKDWDMLVRGEKPPVVSDIAAAPKGELRLRAGYGAV